MSRASQKVEKAYFDFDEKVVKDRLERKGAHHKGPVLYRQTVFDLTGGKTVRVRSSRHGVNLTVKSHPTGEEIELDIGDFDKGETLCAWLGLRKKYHLQKLGETYQVGPAAVVFETYPGLPPYIEIEALDEAQVVSLASELGLKPDDRQDWRISELYLAHYGMKKDRPKGDLTFATAGAVLGDYVTKNGDLFRQRLANQAAVVARL